MKKSNKSSEEPQDRLSDLPDPIIFEIFSLLPMRDFVRTTILSKRWDNLWTTTPYLNFDGHAPEFVNRALMLWKGLKILKFKFGHGRVQKPVLSNIDVWVRLCMENGIEEFYFEDWSMSNDDPPDQVYAVPHRLFSCSSLKMLSLLGCNFQNHGNVHWNQLKSLTVKGFFLNQNLIDKVISASPLLEVFILHIEGGQDENLSIRSTSLKKLSINKQLCYVDDDDYGGDDDDDDEEEEEEPEEHSIVSELRIWSPNLETLDFVGVPYAKYSLVNVSSLTHVTLEFSHYDLIRNDLVGDILKEIFPAIQHVEKLTLSGWCFEGLRYWKEKYLVSPLSNFKFLRIIKSGGDYEEIMDLLPIFPTLDTLVLDSNFIPLEEHVDGFSQVETNLPKSFLLQLRSVELTCIEDEKLIFTFVEILLKHASNLQKMEIRFKNFWRLTPLSLAIQKVARMPRSSPNVVVIVVELS